MAARPLLLRLSECRAEWDALWDASPDASPFTTSRFALALQAVTHWPVDVLAVPGDTGFESAALIYADRLGPWHRAAQPTTAYYNAPLTRTTRARGQEAVTALLDEANRRFDLIAFQTSPTTLDCRPLTWSGFRCEPRYTFATHTPRSADVSRSVGKLMRRHEQRYRYEAASVADADVRRLCLAAYKRDQRRLPLGEDQLFELWSRLEKEGLTRAAVLRNLASGAVEAAKILLDDGRTLSTWLGGSVRGPAQTVANVHVIREAEAAGRALDLLGANTPSVAAFKEAFGVPLRPFFRATRVPAVLRPLHTFRAMV